jgi:transcriptional regulator with XRE-family HTH domain
MASPAFRPSPALCERIAARRRAKKITRADAAFKAGMSTTVYWRIETGKREPRYSDLEAIATALECQVRDLIPAKRAAA